MQRFQWHSACARGRGQARPCLSRSLARMPARFPFALDFARLLSWFARCRLTRAQSHARQALACSRLFAARRTVLALRPKHQVAARARRVRTLRLATENKSRPPLQLFSLAPPRESFRRIPSAPISIRAFVGSPQRATAATCPSLCADEELPPFWAPGQQLDVLYFQLFRQQPLTDIPGAWTLPGCSNPTYAQSTICRLKPNARLLI